MGICKRVPAEKSSAGVTARAGNLISYITNPELENGLEKCICSGAENFISNTQAGQIAEMISLAQESVHSKDPIDHWMISLHDDEKFTPEQAKEAVDIFLKQTGLEGHQIVWGMHDDTKNRHIHIAVNRMNPVTGKVTKINNGFNKEAGQQVIALIEHTQGWKSEKGARYTVIDGKPVMTEQARQTRAERMTGTHSEPLRLSTKKADMEVQTGTKSAQRIGIEMAAPIIKQASTWKELHEQLAARGMQYTRKGSGALVIIDNVPIKASDVDRKAGLSQLEKRFGPYQPAQEINKNDYFDTSRNFTNANAKEPHTFAPGKDTGHGLRNLSQCTLAHSEEGKQASRTGVLQLDARADRSRTGGLRRDTGRGTDHDHGHNTGRTDQGLRATHGNRASEAGERGRFHVKPMKDGQPGWKEYQVIREERRTAKAAATANLSKQQTTERAALFEKQKAERTKLFKGNWQGKGDLRNAMQSILATQHAANKAELSEQQKAERTELQAQYRPLQQYKQWKEQPQIVAEKVRPLIDQHAERDKQPLALSKTLKSLTHHEQRGVVTYQLAGKDVFRDEGKTIQILDLKSDNGIAAALATAQQKYGQTLSLTGSDEFKQKAVAVAVANNLTCKFQDPALDALRERLQAEKYQAEREARQATERAAQAVKDAAVAKAKEEEKAAAQEKAKEAAPALASAVAVDPSNLSEPKARALDVALPALTREELLADIHAQVAAHQAASHPNDLVSSKEVAMHAMHQGGESSGRIIGSNAGFVAVPTGKTIEIFEIESLSSGLDQSAENYDGIATGADRFARGNDIEIKKNGDVVNVHERREEMKSERLKEMERHEQENGIGM